MQSRIRWSGAHSALSVVTRLQAIERAIPLAAVEEVLERHHCQEQRCRKLCMRQVVYLLIAMSLFARERLSLVLDRLLHTCHWLFMSDDVSTPNDAAIKYRRNQLSAAAMADLFHQVCRPLATAHTKGAFLFGLRLMAIDGQRINLPDTPAIARFFGRPITDRGPGAFPQVLRMSLVELGTHATIDTGFWPVNTSEHKAGERLLRSVLPGMLVLLDRGLFSARMIRNTRLRGAHILSRVPANVKPVSTRRLSDGTYLAWVAPAGHHPHKAGEGELVRIITYTFEDPNNPGHRATFRLATTLLDEKAYPGQWLAAAYHERWEIEKSYDESETHLLHGSDPLRSRSVSGLIQELYGMLMAHYAVRALMHEAALQAQIDSDELSFTAAVVLIQEAIRDFKMAAECLLPDLFERLLKEIARHRVQQRPPRWYPRVVKRKMSNFPLKRPAQRGYKTCLPYRQAIRLI